MKKIDILFYNVLFLILGSGGYLYYKARFEDSTRLQIIIITAAGYLSWSIIYHFVRGDLSLKLFLEYLLLFAICLTGAILVQSV